MGKVIDYRDIYERLKEITADRWIRELDWFEKLYEWRMNDESRNDNSALGNTDSFGC